jgi:hypothetical protein
MTKMLLLRVGIDSGSGGALAPRFSDGTFEYVPIPEKGQLIPGRGVSYRDLPGRFGGTLEAYARKAGFAHHDPEFATFTYGEPNEPKRGQLLQMRRGDYLVFYAGLQGDGLGRGTCFVIGYFVVAGVHTPPAGKVWPPVSLQRLHDNAHFRRANAEPSLVVVEGDPGESRFFRKALPLSDDSRNRNVLPEVADKIGYVGATLRAVGHWIPPSHVASAIAWLNTPAGET